MIKKQFQKRILNLTKMKYRYTTSFKNKITEDEILGNNNFLFIFFFIF